MGNRTADHGSDKHSDDENHGPTKHCTEPRFSSVPLPHFQVEYPPEFPVKIKLSPRSPFHPILYGVFQIASTWLQI